MKEKNLPRPFMECGHKVITRKIPGNFYLQNRLFGFTICGIINTAKEKSLLYFSGMCYLTGCRDSISGLTGPEIQPGKQFALMAIDG